MKIQSIFVIPVNIPLVVTIIWSVCLYPGTSKTSIEVITGEGIVGLSEATS